MSDYKYLLTYNNTDTISSYCQLIYYNRNTLKALTPEQYNASSSDENHFTVTNIISPDINKIIFSAINNRHGHLTCCNFTVNPSNIITPVSMPNFTSTPFIDNNKYACVLEWSDGMILLLYNDIDTNNNMNKYSYAVLLQSVGYNLGLTTRFREPSEKYEYWVTKVTTGSFDGIANQSGVTGDSIEVIVQSI